jgi:hypothetical protein
MMRNQSPDGLNRMQYRGRGLEEMSARVGNVKRLVQDLITRYGQVSILEVGFGYGRALLELELLFNGSVSLHGLNRRPEEGNRASLGKLNSYLRLNLADEQIDRFSLSYGDIGSSGTLRGQKFHLVISQMCLVHVIRKLEALEEIHNSIFPGGAARMDLDVLGRHGDAPILLDIRRGRTPIDIQSFLESGAAIRVRSATIGSYLEIVPSGTIPSAAFLGARNLAEVNPHWYGIQSRYLMRDN